MNSPAYLAAVATAGIIVGFYWVRVLRLVRKTRRKHGTSAQFVPREPLGRALRIIWYPTVTLWALHPWITLGFALSGHTAPRLLTPLCTSLLLALPATAIAIAAMWATLVCWRKMGSSWRMGINPGEKTELVVSGPYSRVRHPIYALSSTLMLASAAVIPSPAMLVAAAVHVAFLRWESYREELNLIAVHGEAYAAYMRSTGAFFPMPGRSYKV